MKGGQGKESDSYTEAPTGCSMWRSRRLPASVQPTCFMPGDIRSPVLYPSSRKVETDCSKRLATCSSARSDPACPQQDMQQRSMCVQVHTWGWLRPYLHIIAALSTIASGLAMSWPAMSGADPCTCTAQTTQLHSAPATCCLLHDMKQGLTHQGSLQHRQMAVGALKKALTGS